MPTPEAKLTLRESPQRTAPKTPERIWHDALSFLQAELPRQSFETWVRDLEPTYFDDSTLVLSVANEFAREILEKDFLEAIQRTVSMVIGRAVNVQIIVNHDLSDTTAIRPSQEDIAEFPDTDIRLEITSKFRRYWEEIVDPEKVIPVNRYFLRYWLPILGPSFSSTVLSFKQIRFLHGARTDNAYEVSLSEIMRWHSLKKSAFYKQLEDPHPLLSWFVERAPFDDVPYERDNDGHIRQKPKSYIVYGGIPLCPPHQLMVENLLHELGATEDPEHVVHALEAALKIPDSKLQKRLDESFASYIEQGYSSHPDKAQTILDIARGIIDRNGLEALIDKIARLSDELENRLIRPDQAILLTWYFCRKWSSLLTSPAFWLIIYLRSLGYYDRHTSEVRDIFWIDGGFKELAEKIGVSEDTISGWFGKNRKSVMSRQSEYVQQFIIEQKRERGRNKSNGRSISIQLKTHLIDPLTPEDEKRFISLALSEGYDFIPSLQGIENIPEKSDSGLINSPEIMESGHHNYPERMEAGRRLFTEKAEADEAYEPEIMESGEPDYPEKTESINNLENKITLNQENTSRITTTANLNQLILPLIYSQQALSEEISSSSWDLNSLLRNSALPPKQVEKMLNSKISGRDYVAWLLYAFSSEGAGIDQPVFFAAKRLLNKPPTLAQGDWQCLAEHGPEFVFRNIHYAIDPFEGILSPEWESVMGKVERDRLERLARALGLEHEYQDG